MATSKDSVKKAYAAEIEGQMKEHEAYGDPGWVFFLPQICVVLRDKWKFFFVVIKKCRFHYNSIDNYRPTLFVGAIFAQNSNHSTTRIPCKSNIFFLFW